MTTTSLIDTNILVYAFFLYTLHPLYYTINNTVTNETGDSA
jgi:hypothetical protein